MKKRILAVLTITALTASVMAGCGKKEAPVEEAPEVTTAASTEEVTAEAPATEEVTAEATEEVSAPLITADLDETIGNGILNTFTDQYLKGETQGEGHILMDQEEPDENGEIKCYVLETFGVYEFQDGNFVRSAGSGIIPAVVTVKANDDGTYEFVSIVEAEDGSRFVESIKENFPEALWSRCITIEDDDRNELYSQDRAYAEEYLSSIGREDAEIGEYGDFEHTILTDEGVSVEVSNMMLDVQAKDGFENLCPMWLGEREVLEEGVRYIYKTELDKKKNEIIFSKTQFDSGEVVQSSTYDAKTGDKVE